MLGQALGLSPWMSLIVGSLDALCGHVGVNLCGGEVGVTEQFLHATQIRPGVEHVRGVTMPQFVWRKCGVQAAGV